MGATCQFKVWQAHWKSKVQSDCNAIAWLVYRTVRTFHQCSRFLPLTAASPAFHRDGAHMHVLHTLSPTSSVAQGTWPASVALPVFVQLRIHLLLHRLILLHKPAQVAPSGCSRLAMRHNLWQ